MKKNKFSKYFALFCIFLKAGTFTFAGGLAMLPVIENDIVNKYKFMSKDEFMEYATLSQTLPGVIAVNCACFVGRSCAGTAGMLAASFGAVLPAFVLMIAASAALLAVGQNGAVAGAFRGIRTASAALILSAAFSLGKHNLKNTFSVIVMLISFVLIFFFRISALTVILCSAAAGIFFKRTERFLQRRKKDAE